MTPVIRDWVSLVDEPTALQWFDISDAVRSFNSPESIPLDGRPPFPRCMVVARFIRQGKVHDAALLVAGEDPEEGICLTAWVGVAGKMPRSVPGLMYVVEDGQVLYGALDDDQQPTQRDIESMLGFLAHFYRALKQATPTYIPSVKPGFISQKRIAKGKPPLYEWRTVVIQPYTATRSEPKGTHASPRLHDRRGHERRLPNGKIVWVKPCKVGNAALGTIWHDYKTTLNSQESLQA